MNKDNGCNKFDIQLILRTLNANLLHNFSVYQIKINANNVI